MPRNSRPDIQVLEDRISRLENQLHEYENLRLYSVTKRRLSKVAEELEECVKIINRVVNSGSNNISASSISAFSECPGEGPSEFSNDGDLLDTFLLSSSKDTPTQTPSISKTSAKEIVSTYSKRMKQCADVTGSASGIIQANQFCVLLNSWYQSRYTPANRNPDFYFKAERIHEWIDMLILAAGSAIHDGLFPAFLSEMNTWIGNLNTAEDERWALPYSVMRIRDNIQSCCSREAVLLECIVKTDMYDKSFYPDEKHSVREIVIRNSGFTSKDLKLEAITQSCPKLIVTSSFDATKYEEGE